MKVAAVQYVESLFGVEKQESVPEPQSVLEPQGTQTGKISQRQAVQFPRAVPGGIFNRLHSPGPEILYAAVGALEHHQGIAPLLIEKGVEFLRGQGPAAFKAVDAVFRREDDGATVPERINAPPCRESLGRAEVIQFFNLPIIGRKGEPVQSFYVMPHPNARVDVAEERFSGFSETIEIASHAPFPTLFFKDEKMLVCTPQQMTERHFFVERLEFPASFQGNSPYGPVPFYYADALVVAAEETTVKYTEVPNLSLDTLDPLKVRITVCA